MRLDNRIDTGGGPRPNGFATWECLTPKVIACCGDWHAHERYSVRAVKWCAEHGVDTLLHVGDFGWLFKDRFMTELNAAADRFGVTIGFVAGNHDDHSFLAQWEAVRPNMAIPLRPNIFFLPRNYRWQWDGVDFLALGGAHSIDKPFRRPGLEWWPGETITWQEAERAVSDGPADVMICHDCPTGVSIPGLMNPAGMLRDVRLELPAAHAHRELLRSVVDEVKPGLLFAGHYHCRHTEDLPHDSGHTTTVHILDCDGARFEDNACILSMDEIKRLVWQAIPA